MTSHPLPRLCEDTSNRSDNLLVSICSITYNHAPYIRQCLDGMLMQKTDFAFEIIINDDCSTDGTTEIIREYAAKYPDIIKPVYHDENLYSKGVRGMFNKFVFPKARGKYIALCEGDDYWTDPLKLQKQVDFLEAHPDYSMCFHNAIEKWEKNEKENSQFSNIENRDYDGVEMYKEWIVPTASVVIKKHVVDSEIYNRAINCEKIYYGDIILFLSAASVGKVKGMVDIMSVYRRHEGGMVYSFTYEKRLKNAVHNSYIPKFFGRKYLQYSQSAVLQQTFTTFIQELRESSYMKALTMLIISFKVSFLKTCSFYLRKSFLLLISVVRNRLNNER